MRGEHSGDRTGGAGTGQVQQAQMPGHLQLSPKFPLARGPGDVLLNSPTPCSRCMGAAGPALTAGSIIWGFGMRFVAEGRRRQVEPGLEGI